MLQIENVLKTDFSAYVFSVGYNSTNSSTGVADDDRAVAVVEGLIRGNIDGIRQSLVDANSAISTLQTFDAAVTTISEKLAQMEALAEEVINGYYTVGEKTDMQEDVQRLAQEINSIVENTKYDGNKLFTASGETISIPKGDGSTIDIFAKDLSFNAEGLDLITDAKGALSAIKAARENVSEYGGYLGRQAERLEDAMATIELEYGKAMGIESSDFDTDFAKVLASRLLDDVAILFQIQTDVMPATAARLLEYRGEYTANVG